jgi:hypothetical protein
MPLFKKIKQIPHMLVLQNFLMRMSLEDYFLKGHSHEKVYETSIWEDPKASNMDC